MTPLVRSIAIDDTTLRATTRAFLAEPPDIVVVTTAVGIRAWIARAWSWGLGAELLAALRSTTVVARGAHAAGALAGEGLPVPWRAASETLAEVRDHLVEVGVRGASVAVQRHGGDSAWFSAALDAAGALVTEVAVYATHPTDDRSVPERLSTIVSNGDVSAVTFTSRAAVDAITQPAIRLVELMGERDIVCACVGPVTASAARDAGFAHVISASPSRLGALVHALAQALAARGRDFEFDGIAMRLQGDRIAVSDRGARLTPRERVLLSALLDARGAVLSKQALSRIAWHGEAEEHTVEVTVNRLRRKLGPARRALETTPRRGYRLALTSQPRAGPCAQPVAGRS